MGLSWDNHRIVTGVSPNTSPDPFVLQKYQNMFFLRQQAEKTRSQAMVRCSDASESRH